VLRDPHTAPRRTPAVGPIRFLRGPRERHRGNERRRRHSIGSSLRPLEGGRDRGHGRSGSRFRSVRRVAVPRAGHRRALQGHRSANRRQGHGGRMFGQTHSRGIQVVLSFRSRSVLSTTGRARPSSRAGNPTTSLRTSKRGRRCLSTRCRHGGVFDLSPRSDRQSGRRAPPPPSSRAVP
jgi:hypothetical protein